MTIKEESKLNAKILRLAGHFDFNARKEIKAALDNALQERVSHIILNFEGVSYIDSSGIGMLGNFDNELKSKKIKASLVCLQSKVEKILTMAKLEAKFPIFRTESDALSEKKRPLISC